MATDLIKIVTATEYLERLLKKIQDSRTNSDPDLDPGWNPISRFEKMVSNIKERLYELTNSDHPSIDPNSLRELNWSIHDASNTGAQATLEVLKNQCPVNVTVKFITGQSAQSYSGPDLISSKFSINADGHAMIKFVKWQSYAEDDEDREYTAKLQKHLDSIITANATYIIRLLCWMYCFYGGWTRRLDDDQFSNIGPDGCSLDFSDYEAASRVQVIDFD